MRRAHPGQAKIDFDARAGLEAGYAGAKQAADHADREIVGWKDAATSFFRAYVTRQPFSATFATEDVWRAAEDAKQVHPPPDRRSWGHIAKAMRRERLIEPAGYRPAENKQAHGGDVKLWRRSHGGCL